MPPRVPAELDMQNTAPGQSVCRPMPHSAPTTVTTMSCSYIVRHGPPNGSGSSSTSPHSPRWLLLAAELGMPPQQLGDGLKRPISCASFCKGLHVPFVKHLDRCACRVCLMCSCGKIAHVSTQQLMILDSADLKIVRKIVICDL